MEQDQGYLIRYMINSLFLIFLFETKNLVPIPKIKKFLKNDFYEYFYFYNLVRLNFFSDLEPKFWFQRNSTEKYIIPPSYT